MAASARDDRAGRPRMASLTPARAAAADARRPPAALLRALLYNEHVRSALWQAVAVVGVLVLGLWLWQNATENLARQNIATGFAYLARPASFVISDTPIPYQPSDTYARALLVGLVNTVSVSLLACALATVLGVAIGIARLSANPVLARLALAYIEALRNTPLLLQLFFWYAVVILLPPVRESLRPLPYVYLGNGGFHVPTLAASWELAGVAAAALLGVALATRVAGLARRRAIEAGRTPRTWPLALAVAAAAPLAALAALRPDLTVSLPELGRFRIAGGAHLTPEFTALLTGLALSASAGIAEIVRGGIQSVPKGQWEAAGALGLGEGQRMRLVVLPQALRVIVPPLTSTYLSTTKNSSLAIAIGYPDLVSVSNTTMNQTGQAIEAIAVFMGIYLALSLLTSALMNRYNARVAFKAR